MKPSLRIFEDRYSTFFYSFFVLGFAIQFVTAIFPPHFTALGLSPDETHYWDWSRHLDIAYYSKGPFVAWAIALSRAMFGDTVLAVRLPAIFCASIFYLTFYLFLRRLYGTRVALGVWVLMRSSLMFTQFGVIMTTDAPAAMCWMFAVVFSWEAFQRRDEATRTFWVLVGVSLGIGFWAKYTVALYLPGLLLWAMLLKSARVWRGLAVTTLTFLAFCLPILFWNIQHSWVNFQHNAMHVVKKKGESIVRFDYLLELLLGQMGLLGPFVLLGIIFAFIEVFEKRKVISEEAKLFFVTSVPIALLICAVSLRKRVYANWPLPIYIGGLCLLAYMFARHTDFSSRFRKWIVPALSVNILIFTVSIFLVFGYSFWVPGTFLPTKKLYGWSELGRQVAEYASTVKDASTKKLFFMSDRYGVASSLSFYIEDHPSVMLASAGQRRMAQQDIWQSSSDWEALSGANAVVVLQDRVGEEFFAKRFKKFFLEDVVRMNFSNSEIREFGIYYGEHFDGKPAPSPTGR